MIKEVYLDVLRNELIDSIKKFDFIVTVNPYKFYSKYCQDYDPKHKSYLCKPGYYTTVPKLLILLPKVLILTLSKIWGFI